MNEELVLKLIYEALLITLKLSMPILLVSLIVGLVVGIFQATTQIQETTLSFIPKMIAIFMLVFFIGHWMLKTLMDYSIELIRYIENFK